MGARDQRFRLITGQVIDMKKDSGQRVEVSKISWRLPAVEGEVDTHQKAF